MAKAKIDLSKNAEERANETGLDVIFEGEKDSNIDKDNDSSNDTTNDSIIDNDNNTTNNINNDIKDDDNKNIDINIDTNSNVEINNDSKNAVTKNTSTSKGKLKKPKKEETKDICVHIFKSQLVKLNELKEESDFPRDELIRMAINDFLKKYGKM